MKQAQEHLRQEWLRLETQWQKAGEQWRDLLRHRFEREFMQAYEPTVFDTLQEMRKLEEIIARARREVV